MLHLRCEKFLGETRCNTLQHTATRCNDLGGFGWVLHWPLLRFGFSSPGPEGQVSVRSLGLPRIGSGQVGAVKAQNRASPGGGFKHGAHEGHRGDGEGERQGPRGARLLKAKRRRSLFIRFSVVLTIRYYIKYITTYYIMSRMKIQRRTHETKRNFTVGIMGRIGRMGPIWAGRKADLCRPRTRPRCEWSNGC